MPSKHEAKQISVEQYEEATDASEGFCTSCQAFTTDCVEPDAEGYKCEACGERAVVGAEQALLLGVIELA